MYSQIARKKGPTYYCGIYGNEHNATESPINDDGAFIAHVFASRCTSLEREITHLYLVIGNKRFIRMLLCKLRT